MDKIILPVSRIRAAAPARKPGHLEECLRLGKISGEFVEFTVEQFADIRRRFTLSDASDKSDLSDKRGLGDAVHRMAGPIGRALHWPCMKGDGPTDLKPGSPCDQIRKILNAKF
ncbi:MAG: hypothetical protein ACLQU4_11975 [Limisphaerales bacterium]